MRKTLKFTVLFMAGYGALEFYKRMSFGIQHGSELRGMDMQEIDNAYHAHSIK